jgi:predicted Zn-dependent protease with MMP-like domain
MDNAKFEKLVTQAIDSLPDEFMEYMENIDIVIADEPTRAQLRHSDMEKDMTLLGLYEGVPMTERTTQYSLVPPDKITIFKNPIESFCKNDDETVKEVRRVVLHEIAHHFGIDDDRLDELGM